MPQRPEPSLSPDDLEALNDANMWVEKLRHLANIEVEHPSYRPDSAEGQIPTHSQGVFHHLGIRHLRWRATDGSGHGGALALLRGRWFEKDAAYDFPPDVHAMIVDVHNDQAMAFLSYKKDEDVDQAQVVAAAAGEEGSAVSIARSMGEYLRKAVAARFSNYWFLEPDLGRATRDWVDAQPLRDEPNFEVKVEAVEPADAGALRAQMLDWLSSRGRKSIAVAAGYEGTDGAGLSRAIEQVLATGKPAAQKKLTARLLKDGGNDYRRDFFLDPLPEGLLAVRLYTTRLRSAHLDPSRSTLSPWPLQLLLDCSGAEALHQAVGNLDHVRFSSARFFDIAERFIVNAFARQPEKTLPQGRVHGQLHLVALLPRALLPTGCEPGATFHSIAPAGDGTYDGKVLKSI
ncbi:hypothetical protein [Myxococcus qinghaiensis]|uniref:hypothetical protein n=1 Tax=Myxococcus qinghaiensis TaxID=2906758 RepID=UPI0020A7C302|nr:hypothetical protein [Myxococcus qinghaiensis]MCP3169546.1 hypothetical protein [Myxococcus qinghaiensis]